MTRLRVVVLVTARSQSTRDEPPAPGAAPCDPDEVIDGRPVLQ